MKFHATATTKQEIEILENATDEITSAELYPCEKAAHKFSIGDRLELFGMQDYPEFDGEIVTITAYRKGDGENLGYYIKPDSPEVDRFLNFVYEYRLREIKNAN